MARLEHADDLVRVEFTRGALMALIALVNKNATLDEWGNRITLELDEYAPGQATFWAKAWTAPMQPPAEES